jgi:hypothetical protein
MKTVTIHTHNGYSYGTSHIPQPALSVIGDPYRTTIFLTANRNLLRKVHRNLTINFGKILWAIDPRPFGSSTGPGRKKSPRLRRIVIQPFIQPFIVAFCQF